MADLKITELTENTTPITTDLLPMVDDPGGTPLTQKVTLGNIAGLSLLKSKVIVVTRDLSAVTADVSYTGVGFKPTSLIAVYGIDGGVMMGFGISDSAKGGANTDRDNAEAIHVNAYFICAITTGSNNQLALVKTYDTDGFTLTWTKSGTPTGTLYVYVLALL